MDRQMVIKSSMEDKKNPLTNPEANKDRLFSWDDVYEAETCILQACSANKLWS